MMEKVKIRKCESIMDGKAHAIELADGRKATAWCDKVDCAALKTAYDLMCEIDVEIKPYKSKIGKEGLNIVAIATSDHHNPNAEGVLPTGKASANGQYQKSVEEENESWEERKERIMTKPTGSVELPAPEEYGEADITSINAKSSVKIKKNSKGIGWEIKVVSGEEDLMKGLIEHAIVGHKHMCVAFPAETVTAG